MDPRRLLLFAAVVEHGSITRAASALHLSQPSLSRQVASLELEAGLPLLDRLPAGVEPTTAGRRLLRRAEAAGAQIEAARRELDELRQLAAGELRLVAFPTAAATVALDALLALRDQRPGITVTIEERDRVSALRAVTTAAADIAITFADLSVPRDDRLETEALLQEPMLIALAAGHPRAEATRLELADLRDEPWIVGTGAPHASVILRACAAAGFAPRIAARLDHQPAIQAAVAAGVGVTLVPALATRRVLPEIAVREPSSPRPTRQVFMHVLAGPRAPATEAGLAVLRDVAAEPVVSH
jgi:DNA-binding transcriptional LysR family regulator